MFKKNKQTKSIDLNQQEITTLIGHGYEITGEITGKSFIRIDGNVTGNVSTEAGIILGEKGIVIGNINTKSVIIFGTVNGDVMATQLEIKATGVVNGNIRTDTLEIELGAKYNGRLEMNQLIKTEEKLLKVI